MTQSTAHVGHHESDEVLAEFTQAVRAAGRNLERIGYRLGMTPRGSRGLRGRNGRRAVSAARRERGGRPARLDPQQRREREQQYPMAQLAGRWAVAHEIANAAERQRDAFLADSDSGRGDAERWQREAELARQHADAWDKRVNEHGVDTDELRRKIDVDAPHNNTAVESVMVADVLAQDYLAEHIEVGDAQSVADLKTTALSGQEVIDVGAPNGVNLPPTTSAEHQVTAEPAYAGAELASVADLDVRTAITAAADEWPTDGVGTANNQGMDL